MIQEKCGVDCNNKYDAIFSAEGEEGRCGEA